MLCGTVTGGAPDNGARVCLNLICLLCYACFALLGPVRLWSEAMGLTSVAPDVVPYAVTDRCAELAYLLCNGVHCELISRTG